MGAKFRANLSRETPTFADKHDMIGATTETALKERANAPQGLTAPSKEVTAVNDRSRNERQSIALEYLSLARRDFENAARARIRYVLLAREYGVPNVAIADVLGINESSVRGLIARHGGDA